MSSKVARLPARGVLIAASDLQGNLQDYLALKAIHAAERERDPGATLVLTGDLVHGPSPDLGEPDAWPSHLGTAYQDRSAELILDFMEYQTSAPAIALIGNHEHAHIGGPMVSKFYLDEAAVLEATLGEKTKAVQTFIRTMPLIAVSKAGVVLTHGAPRATEPTLEAFEALHYGGFEAISIHEMYARGTVGALLWARGASAKEARALLRVATLDGEPAAFVAYGHDVVREGYQIEGDEQICFSTSYGLFDRDKVYLRLDLSHRYRSARELREGFEILKLYPRAS